MGWEEEKAAALRAGLIAAGHDPDDEAALDKALVACIRPGKRHKESTITKRMFPHGGGNTLWVRRRLLRLEEAQVVVQTHSVTRASLWGHWTEEWAAERDEWVRIRMAQRAGTMPRISGSKKYWSR